MPIILRRSLSDDREAPRKSTRRRLLQHECEAQAQTQLQQPADRSEAQAQAQLQQPADRSGSPATPPRSPPGALVREPSPETPSPQQTAHCDADLDPAILESVAGWLQTWRDNLINLQPLVGMEDGALHGAVALVQELFRRRTDLQEVLAVSPPHLAAYAAAALWTTSKIVGVRTESPNRSLVAQATGCHPQALAEFEVDLVHSLSWDMAAVLRAGGALC
eukprot:scaffold14.g1259.t1